MADAFANFRSTVTEHLDTKLQLIDVKFSGSVISKFNTMETNTAKIKDSEFCMNETCYIDNSSVYHVG